MNIVPPSRPIGDDDRSGEFYIPMDFYSKRSRRILAQTQVHMAVEALSDAMRTYGALSPRTVAASADLQRAQDLLRQIESEP